MLRRVPDKNTPNPEPMWLQEQRVPAISGSLLFTPLLLAIVGLVLVFTLGTMGLVLVTAVWVISFGLIGIASIRSIRDSNSSSIADYVSPILGLTMLAGSMAMIAVGLEVSSFEYGRLHAWVGLVWALIALTIFILSVGIELRFAQNVMKKQEPGPSRRLVLHSILYLIAGEMGVIIFLSWSLFAFFGARL